MNEYVFIPNDCQLRICGREFIGFLWDPRKSCLSIIHGTGMSANEILAGAEMATMRVDTGQGRKVDVPMMEYFREYGSKMWRRYQSSKSGVRHYFLAGSLGTPEIVNCQF